MAYHSVPIYLSVFVVAPFSFLLWFYKGRIVDPCASNVANTIARALQPWCLKTKKSNQAKMLVGFFRFLPTRCNCECRGVGGIRTLVQTCTITAFYMFSFCLDFRAIAGQKLPTHALS